MKTTPPPATMTAQERRHEWYNNQENSLTLYLRDFDIPLKRALDRHFQAIEAILGEEDTGARLLDMLPGDHHNNNPRHDILGSSSVSPLRDHWKSATLLDHAGLYGLYGVTPADLSFKSRGAWVARLPVLLDDWRQKVTLDKDGKDLGLVINLALSRHAMDTGMSLESITSMEEPVEGHVDIRSLSIFGGISEGRIRNMLSSGESCLEKVKQGMTASSAAEWLKGRKDYYPSIWEMPDSAEPTVPSINFTDDVVFVPVAADNSSFHPGLARNGQFTIGAKGEEVQYESFEKALTELQKMATPRWRRPNSAGNWGIVSGRDWKRIERSTLIQPGI